MCTDFMLPKLSLKAFSGRTLDFDDTFSDWYLSGIPSDPEIQLKGHFLPVNDSTLPNLKHTYVWSPKYGCVGFGLKYGSKLTGINPQYGIGDGINEAGFSAAALWLPGTVFPRRSEAPEGMRLLSGLDIVLWALTSYESCDDLAADLTRIKDCYEDPACMTDADLKLPAFWNPLQYSYKEATGQDAEDSIGWGNLMPFHYVFHDKMGASLVLEFRNKKMEITDTTSLGVLTNNPFLDWHYANLGNYLNLTNVDVEEETIVQMPVHTTGDGGATLGMPGSSLPSARFVRTANFLNFGKDWLAGVDDSVAHSFVFNLLGNVAVLRTSAIQTQHKRKEDIQLFDYTQISILRDHKNAELLFRTGYGIGTWSVNVRNTLKEHGMFCTHVKNLNEGVPFVVEK